MDNTQATVMADYTKRGVMNLDSALQWHFSINLSPRIPAYFVPIAIRAIKKANLEEWDADLFLRDGLELTGRNGPFSPTEIIDMMNLTAFVECDHA
ncbi:MAG TPA: hypothetical protein ENI07_06205 [Desulfobacterales bacterium]|nr:hypothetical protein [Desulfobacterales bacterium]